MAFQPVLHPVKSAPVLAMDYQLLQEYAVGDSVRGFDEIQVDNRHSLPVTHQVRHLVIKGDEIGQAGPVYPKPTSLGLIPWLSCICHVITLNLFHNQVPFP